MGRTGQREFAGRLRFGAYSRSERAKIVRAVKCGSLIFVAATSGARRGELCGLRWSDLDLDLATMTISRSVRLRQL